MNKLAEKHLEAIDTNIELLRIDKFTTIQGKYETTAACTDISIEFAKWFIEWINKYGWAKVARSDLWICQSGLTIAGLTFEQLTSEYIKTL